MLSKQEIAGLRELLAKAVETPWVIAPATPLTIVAEFEAHLPLGGSIEPGHDARHYAWPIARMADPNGLPRWSAEQTAANAAIIAAAVNVLPALLDIAEAVANAPVGKVESIDMCTERPTWHVMDDRGMPSIEIGGKQVALVVLPLAGEVATHG